LPPDLSGLKRTSMEWGGQDSNLRSTDYESGDHSLYTLANGSDATRMRPCLSANDRANRIHASPEGLRVVLRRGLDVVPGNGCQVRRVYAGGS
jgi:hypothetical protein